VNEEKGMSMLSPDAPPDEKEPTNEELQREILKDNARRSGAGIDEGGKPLKPIERQ
jgi:hypothetical protein